MSRTEDTGASEKKARSKFTKTEDRTLFALVAQSMAQSDGQGVDWKRVAEIMDKTARQCRERYSNYLAPDLAQGPWTPEEDALLREKVQELGCRWAQMTRYFVGRSGVRLKNRWNALETRRQESEMQPQTIERTELVLSPARYAFYHPSKWARQGTGWTVKETEGDDDDMVDSLF